MKLVRYEDLKARPAAAFQEVLDFAGVTPGLPLDACLDLCAPAALRRLEDVEVAAGAPGLFGAYQANKQSDARFVNDAAAGGYRAKLSEAQIQAGLDSLGDLMAALGYDVAAYRAAA